MKTTGILILAASLTAAVQLTACTGGSGTSEKTGDAGVSAPVVAPTGQTDTSAPGTTVPTPATPAPQDPATGGGSHP